MSERYSKLFSLPENLYAEGSPVIVQAGNLLKDNQTGKVLAQLKIKSIAAKQIKAVTVLFHPQDAAGKPMKGDMQQKYLDLTAKAGDEFGQKTAVFWPDASTRGFSVEVTQVVFTDSSTWEGSSAPWEPLPAPGSLSNMLADAELLKQYQIRFGGKCDTAPQTDRDLWLCACGTWNRDATGYSCGTDKDLLLNLDLEALKAERDARLAEEKARREAMAADNAEKSKKAKKRGIIAAAVLLAFLFVAAVFLYGIPALLFKQGNSLEESGDYLAAMGKYEKAAGSDMYDRDGHVRSRIRKIRPAADYQAGELALEEGRLLDALDAFLSAKNYQDASERVAETAGKLFETELAAGPDMTAERCRKLADETGDSSIARVLQTAALQYYLDAADPDGAKALLQALYQDNAYKNEHAELYGELRLIVSRWYLDQGDYENAQINVTMVQEDFVAGSDYLNTERKEILYEIGLQYYKMGKYSDAGRVLSSLGEYRDSPSYIRRAEEMNKIEKFRTMVNNSGNYSSGLDSAKSVDMNVLTDKERDAFQTELYDLGNMLENRGRDSEDYKYAFYFYKLSQKGDFESRMKACNEQYLKMPHVLTNKFTSQFPDFRITDVSASYASGKVTFTVQYTAAKSGNWYFAAWTENDEFETDRKSGKIQKGTSSFSFTVSSSEELSTFYFSKKLMYWDIIIGTSDWSYYDKWYVGDRSFFENSSIDLYALKLA